MASKKTDKTTSHIGKSGQALILMCLHVFMWTILRTSMKKVSGKAHIGEGQAHLPLCMSVSAVDEGR